MTLRIKILAAITLVLGVTVGASFLVLIRYQRAQLLRNTSQATSQLANAIRATLEHAMLANDPAEIQRIVSTVGEQAGIAGVYVLDSRDTVRATSMPTQRGRPLPEQPPSVIRSASPIPNTPRCQGCHPPAQRLLGQLVVDRSPEAMEKQLRTSLGYMLASAGLAFLLLTLTTYAVLRRLVVTPLANLGRAARAIQAGQYDTPLTLQRSDEVGELARTLEQMRCRIMEHLEEIRRWGAELEVRVAERTEELRRSQAEIVQRERQIAALEAVRAATVTLSHHVNNATAGIAGCRDVLASALGEETDWQFRYALDGIRASVKKISAVLQALQDLTQVNVTNFPGGLEAIDVDRAIQVKLAELQADAHIADPPPPPPDRQRDHDEDDYRVEEHPERDLQRRGPAHQQPHDQGEQHQHDEIVEGDLDQRIRRISSREVAPDKDHRRTRRRREDDAPGDVLRGAGEKDPSRKDVPEEQPRNQRHRERFDRSIDEQRDQQSPGPPAHVADRGKVHLHHHGDDHQPNEHSDGRIDLAPHPELEASQGVDRLWSRFADE